MQCPRCKSPVPEKSTTCLFCGNAIDRAAAPASPVLTPAVPSATSGKAIASMVFGFFFFLLPLAIVAVFLGHLSLSQIKKSAGTLGGRGMALTGLVLGYLGVAFIPLILIVAAIAIPNLLRARLSANETTAVNSVRYLNQAETSYAALHPEAGFACDFDSLIRAGVLDASLVRTPHHGYVFGLQACGPAAAGKTNTHYQIVARPLQQNTTGVRAFCSDQSGVVRFDRQGSAEACVEKGQQL
jgi:hypothetical protein